MDIIGIDKAVDELTKQTVPEALTGLKALVDQLRDLLDGATITITISLRK